MFARSPLVLPAILMLACGHPGGTPGRTSTADSVVLERTPCFGACPTYRLRIAQDGSVHFRSMTRGDTGRIETGTIPVETFDRLIQHAERAGFYSMPERIMGNPRLCPLMATDHSGVNVSIYTRRGGRTVYDYLGCRAQADTLATSLGALREFEEAVDSAAGTARWLRPVRN